MFHFMDSETRSLLGPWKDKGRALEARLLLHKVFHQRFFYVSTEVILRIEAEGDIARIESWVEAAVNAAATSDVFRDEPGEMAPRKLRVEPSMTSYRSLQEYLDDAEKEGRIEEARLLLRKVIAARRFLIDPEGRVHNDSDESLSALEWRFAQVVGPNGIRHLSHDCWLQDQGEEWKKGWAQARTEEARWLLHKVLAARAFDVAPDLRARIDDEVDRGRLESWIMSAAKASAIGEVFESPANAPGVSLSALA